MMTTVVIYSNGSQECERMSMLLRSLECEFHEYRLGQHFTEQQFRTEFGSKAEYPQCAIGSRHIGGMNDTLKYMKSEGVFQ